MSRVAVVTGGASGMGRSICGHLARRGDRVAVLDVNTAGADHVAAEARRHRVAAIACTVDVSDRAAVDAALARVRDQLGPVEILVTCAGISEWETLTEIDVESWNRILAVNLTGTFHCIRAAVPDMVAAGWGRIVTISSAAAQTGYARHAHYAASKGGVVALTRAIAREFAPTGITVNTIAPGAIDTPMREASRRQREAIGGTGELSSAHGVPVGRIGTGDDIAAACLYLCSDQAGYVTGQLIGVNGGTLP